MGPMIEEHDGRDRGSDSGGAAPVVSVSGQAIVEKLLVVQHADRVVIGPGNLLTIATTGYSQPTSLEEELAAVAAGLSATANDDAAHVRNRLYAIAARLQRVIARLTVEASRGAPHVNAATLTVSALIGRIELVLPEASSLRADLAMLYTAMGDYMSSLREAERLLDSQPSRSRNLMLAGTALLNMCDFSTAKAVFDAVAESTDLVRPSAEQESQLENLTAEQFRQLWIPHYEGKPVITLRNAPRLLAKARQISVGHEAGILHRLARAQNDLALAQHDRNLLSASLRNHRRAMRLIHGDYNFHMPMAEYYTLNALGAVKSEKSWHEAHDLSYGLNEGAQAHIFLMESRQLRMNGQYFAAVEQADRAIRSWRVHPHPKGVVDSLASRAHAHFDIGTRRSILLAAEDLAVASAIASGRGFDVGHEARLLRPRCSEILEKQEKLQVAASVKAMKGEFPNLFSPTRSTLTSIVASSLDQ